MNDETKPKTLKQIQLMRENGEIFLRTYTNDHPPFTFDNLLADSSPGSREIMFHYFKTPTRADALLKVIDDVKELLLNKHNPLALDGVSALSDMFNMISKLRDEEFNFIRLKVNQYERKL